MRVTSKDGLISRDIEIFDVLLAEPFFYENQKDLEWKNLLAFWYEKVHLKDHFSEKTRIVPAAASLYGMLVEFKNFEKQFKEVKINGIDKSVVNNALHCAKPVIAHSLWMYRFRALSEPFEVMSFDFYSDRYFHEKRMEESVVVGCEGVLHGVVLWVDYYVLPDVVVSTRPVLGEQPTWYRQGVFMFDDFVEVEKGAEVMAKVLFDPYENDIKFQFELMNNI